VIPIPLRSIGLTHGGSQVKSGLSILQKKFYTTPPSPEFYKPLILKDFTLSTRSMAGIGGCKMHGPRLPSLILHDHQPHSCFEIVFISFEVWVLHKFQVAA
jgi:hypothetical protein